MSHERAVEINDKIISHNDSFADWRTINEFFEKHPEAENEFYNVTGAMDTTVESGYGITYENRGDNGINGQRLYDDLHMDTTLWVTYYPL